MKLAQFEKLLVNVEGFLYKPELIKINNDLMVNDHAWVYRATVTLAVGVKPITLRVLQASGDHREPTCPRFVGAFRLESEPFHLDAQVNGKIRCYHRQADVIAKYAAANNLFAAITEFPPKFEISDPRFADILKQEDDSQ